MTREELADKMASLPNPPSRVHLVQQVYDIMHEDISMLENRIEELERDKKDLIFVRNQTAKCMCEDKERLAKATKIIKGLLELGSIGDGDYTYVRDAEQFLSEAKK